MDVAEKCRVCWTCAKRQPVSGMKPIRRKDGKIIRYKCKPCIANSKLPLEVRDAFGQQKTQERHEALKRLRQSQLENNRPREDDLDGKL